MVTKIGPKRPVKLYLAEWRESRNLTQEELANRLGTTKGTISRWEGNSRMLNVGALAAIAEALNCTTPDLYRDPDQPSADELLRQRMIQVIEDLKTGTGGS